MEGQTIITELQPEHGGIQSDGNGPMLYGSYDTHSKTWNSKKKRVSLLSSNDTDFDEIFGGRVAKLMNEV